VKEDEMSPMQKRNKRIDELKDKWALMHGIPILRIWEKDINESPEKVLKMLKERLYIQDKKNLITENKNKRHINKIK
jgi:very-short-patch-repair endonuclease